MSKRKGILLAGGHGSRMNPCSISVNKHLFPVYDKPMIYYPLSTLMLSEIKEILIITNPQDLSAYKALLKDGSQWGITLKYEVQTQPKGIAEAFIIGEKFIGDNSVCLALGDNILYGDRLPAILLEASNQQHGATILAYTVKDASRYGILSFNTKEKIVDIVEKPKSPQSKQAVIGVYFYDNDVIRYAKSLHPSARGELEITDINLKYLAENKLQAKFLGRGMAWLDTGTPEALLQAAQFIHALEERQGLKIGCPEEIAWRLKYISTNQLARLAQQIGKCDYADYLLGLLSSHNKSHTIIGEEVVV